MSSTPQDQVKFEKAFSWWKIALAVLLGLSIATWMMYRSLNQTQLIPVENQSGNYVWIGKTATPDLSNAGEFQFQKNGDYELDTIGNTLRNIRWTSSSYLWLLAAILGMVGRDFFYIVRIRILTKKSLSWFRSTVVILLWEFASALSPGVVGGAAVAMFILNREKIPLGRSTAIVIITAFMDNLFYIVMIPFVFLFIQPSVLFPSTMESAQSVEMVFWSGFAIILIVCLFLFLTLFFLPKLATQFLKKVFSIPFLSKWKPKAVQTGLDLEIAALELKQEKINFWTSTFMATLASWISRYLVINFILNAFLELRFIDNIVLLGKQLVLWLFMLVSPTPGASGVAEYAFGELLATFSASTILIASLAILWRLISYFPYLFIGAFILPRWLKKTK
jgi:uncharacterized protein (TIRG00374 family)